MVRRKSLPTSLLVWGVAGALCCGAILPLPASAGSAAVNEEYYSNRHVLLKVRSVAGKALQGDAGLARLHARYGVVSAMPLLADFGNAAYAAKRAAGSGDSPPASMTDLALWHVVEFSGSVDPLLVSAAYATLDAVETAQPNYLRRFCAAPDDPLYPQQSNLHALLTGDLPVGDAEGIIVAVIDSGVDYLHADVAHQIWVNTVEFSGEEGVDDDANGYIDDVMGWDFTDAPGQAGSGDFLRRDSDPMDESGHGTHVAGIIGAGVDNGIGIAGLAPGVCLMVLRAGFQVAGAGYLEDDDVAAAIVYAVDNGAHIVNLSLGDPSFSPLLRDVIRYAADAGVVVVAAVGNEGDDQVFYPARLEQTIAVAATSDRGRIATFSNWGPDVDIAAPGVGILSLSPGGSYVERSGTSMSTAHVSAAAALLLARWPHLNPEQVRSALMHTAIDVDSRGWDPHSGAGFVQVSASPPQSPLTIQLQVDDSVMTDEVDSITIRVGLMGAGEVSYTLSWGAGTAPVEWTPFASQAFDIEPGAHLVLQETWSGAGLADSTYVIRAEALSAEASHSDHTVIQLHRGAPVVESMQWRRALEGDHWNYTVEWLTDVPSMAVLEVRGRDDDLLFELTVPQRRSAHRVVLPEDLGLGVYEVGLRTVPAAAGGEFNLTVEVAERSVIRWHFEHEATAVDGYLMPSATDFDANGQPELAAMVYGGGAYGTVSFFEPRAEETAGQQLFPVHTTSRLFIPWSVHDLDADGLPELMAIDAERVRLLESGDGVQRFPNTVIWEQTDVWGGAVGDLDADGRQEMYLRSSRGSLLRTYEYSGSDNDFTQVSINANPTVGPNSIGERQVIGDFDDDGRGDLLVGDEDGDVFVLESVGDDTLAPVWVRESETDNEDGRLVGGGVDLDGDGLVEFVVGRLVTDRFDLNRTRWSVTIYEHTGNDDEYQPEYELLVLGGKGQGNGFSMGDLDGDGLVELSVALVPDLYVVRASGPDEYEPVWHTSIQNTHRALVADTDGDGVMEIAYNSAAGAIEIISLAEARAIELEAPAGLVAIGLGPDRVAVSWEAVDGATEYRLYRESEAGPQMLTQVSQTTFVDVDVEGGRVYSYAVAAVDSDNTDGRRSAPQSATPAAVPALLGVDRLTSRHLVLDFDGAMGPSVEKGFRYLLRPDLRSPSSAIRVGDGRRVVLAFDDPLPAGSYELSATDLRAASGAPLADGQLSFSFELEAIETVTHLVHAQVERPTELLLRFNAGLQQALPSNGIVVDDGRIKVDEVTVLSDTEVAVLLSPDTPLKPWGRRYEVAISGWLDASGGVVTGRTFVQWAPSTLGVHVFPNPFDPSQGNLVFGGLPPGSRVSIYSVAGESLRTLREEEGAGGVEWDGTNDTGERCANGLYYYRVTHDGVARTGSFAVIRR